MTQRLDEEVAVNCQFDTVHKKVKPISVFWGHRQYVVKKLGLYHHYRVGLKRIHVFSVITTNLFMRLELNSHDLSWRLTEIADGLPE